MLSYKVCATRNLNTSQILSINQNVKHFHVIPGYLPICPASARLTLSLSPLSQPSFFQKLSKSIGLGASSSETPPSPPSSPISRRNKRRRTRVSSTSSTSTLTCVNCRKFNYYDPQAANISCEGCGAVLVRGGRRVSGAGEGDCNERSAFLTHVANNPISARRFDPRLDSTRLAKQQRKYKVVTPSLQSPLPRPPLPLPPNYLTKVHPPV